MSFGQMPKAFGFEELEKGTFSYLYNHPDNYGATLPDKEYYDPDLMKPEKFDAWYAENVNKPFNFDTEILRFFIVFLL